MGSNLRGTYVASSVQLAAGMPLVARTAFAANAVTFSGLSGQNRYFAYVEATTDAAGQIALEINADTNALHYHTESFGANDAVMSSGRGNTNQLAGYSGAGGYFHVVYIARNGSGYATYSSDLTGPSGGSIILNKYSGSKDDATVTEITGLKFLAVGCNITGYISLYKGTTV
jgi:hypothetical protein